MFELLEATYHFIYLFYLFKVASSDSEDRKKYRVKVESLSVVDRATLFSGFKRTDNALIQCRARSKYS